MKEVITPTETVFYMVYLHNGSAPAHRHTTIEEAEQEARRLTQKHNCPAYVLQAFKRIEVVAQFNEVTLA